MEAVGEEASSCFVSLEELSFHPCLAVTQHKDGRKIGHSSQLTYFYFIGKFACERKFLGVTKLGF